MTYKPRPISGNEPFDAISKDYNRYCGRIVGNELPGAWNPSKLQNLSIWYDPSDISTLFQDSAGLVPVTSNLDPVGKILDKSGNGYHLIQTATASKPTYVTSGIGGVPSLSFDGGDFLTDTVSGNPVSLYQVGASHSVYGVARDSGGIGSNAVIIGHLSSGFGWILGSFPLTDKILHTMQGVSDQSPVGQTVKDNDLIFHAEFNNPADTSERFINGVSVEVVPAVVDPILANVNDRLTIGAAHGAATSWQWSGLLGEIIITPTISAIDRNNIVNYDKNKYGIS